MNSQAKFSQTQKIGKSWKIDQGSAAATDGATSVVGSTSYKVLEPKLSTIEANINYP